MPEDFRVPELGENVKSARVAKVLVARGAPVRRDQTVVELEVDKAVLEVPSDVDGIVATVPIKIGDDVQVGQTLFTISVTRTAPQAPATPLSERPAPADHENTAGASPALTGPPAGAPQQTMGAERQPVPAAPSVRRLAREIGVDIRAVTGTGPRGRINLDDLKAYARSRSGVTPRPPAGGGTVGQALPDLAAWGPTERQPMTTLRRLTAERMSHAWSVIPHVTQFGKADITDVEHFRDRYSEAAEHAGARLTLMAVVIKAVAGALECFPNFNASVDPQRSEIVLRKYCHIGVAMDTPRGLVVPVLRDADRKTILDIATELSRLTVRARDGKLAPDDLRGGCFTLTNAGALGGDLFTPIINWPEAAILGMARSRTEAVHREGAFIPRLMLPLALSYDHRLIDGADGVRFMRWMIEALETPVRLRWEG